MAKATIEFNPQSSAIALDAVLCGSEAPEKRIKMIFDTGATYTMIPWEIAEALGYQSEVSKRRVILTTASGVERAPLITLSSVQVLGAKVENVEVAVHDLPPSSHVDGLLGLSFIRNFKVSLDFEQGVLELTPLLDL